MELMTEVTHFEDDSNTPRRVRVPGRNDIGEVIDMGKNFGFSPSVYCLGIHFPETGECAYYDARRVTYVDT